MAKEGAPRGTRGNKRSRGGAGKASSGSGSSKGGGDKGGGSRSGTTARR